MEFLWFFVISMTIMFIRMEYIDYREYKAHMKNETYIVKEFGLFELCIFVAPVLILFVGFVLRYNAL